MDAKLWSDMFHLGVPIAEKMLRMGRMSVRERSIGTEADLVVGLGEHEHSVGDRLEFSLPGPVALQDVLQQIPRLVEVECCRSPCTRPWSCRPLSPGISC